MPGAWRVVAFALAMPLAVLGAVRPPAARLPHVAQHTEFVVEVNGKGQVTRVRSGKASRDAAFNTMTLGNALQAFIRTASGRSVAGIYRLGYDYDPKTARVRRTVALLRVGGVDPNRLGAVDQMATIARRRPQTPPSAAPSHLPDFGSITGANR